MDGQRARAVLGVPAHATSTQIRRAFRVAVMRAHPDHGGDRADFESVWDAYQVLKKQPAPGRRVYATCDVVQDAPRTFDRYDSPRPRPRRVRFEDVLRAALAA